MRIIDLSDKDVQFDYLTDCVFINHPNTSLQLVYEDGRAMIIPDPNIDYSELDDFTDDEINLWIPFLSVPDINSVQTGLITVEICRISNIQTIYVFDAKVIEKIEEWITDINDAGDQTKSIEYISKPNGTILIDSTRINPSIVRLNIPLNQNLQELHSNNPHLIEIGINGDNFGYWNALPDVHLTVYTTSIVNMRMSNYYLSNHRKTIHLR